MNAVNQQVRGVFSCSLSLRSAWLTVLKMADSRGVKSVHNACTTRAPPEQFLETHKKTAVRYFSERRLHFWGRLFKD
jgi:hypothetical protein